MMSPSCVRLSLLCLLSCLLYSPLTESETSYTWRLDLTGEGKIVADMGGPGLPTPGEDNQVPIERIVADPDPLVRGTVPDLSMIKRN
jgi:hypothetical protein